MYAYIHRTKEIQVIDYQTQQFKLFPLIATAYALLKAGQYMMRMFIQCRAEISEGNLESLPEVSQCLPSLPDLTVTGVSLS